VRLQEECRAFDHLARPIVDVHCALWEEAAWGARAWKSHDWDVLDRLHRPPRQDSCQAELVDLSGGHAPASDV
jgi:hypothetical protein